MPFKIAIAICYLSIVVYPWLLMFGVLSFRPLHLLAIVVWAFVPSWINVAHKEVM